METMSNSSKRLPRSMVPNKLAKVHNNVSQTVHRVHSRSPSRQRRETYNEPHPRVLDVIGCHREITLCGHADLVRRLPIRMARHRRLLEQYARNSGNYEGRYSGGHHMTPKLTDYGNSFITLKLYDDITRPELGEFLLSRGWKMIGFATSSQFDKTYITEKWCNIKNH